MRVTFLCLVAAVVVLGAACGGEAAPAASTTIGSSVVATVSTVAVTTPPAATSTTTIAPAATSTATVSTSIEATTTTPATTTTDVPSIPIRLRIDRRVDDAATLEFAETVEEILTDQRGWEQAGFLFSFDGDEADYTVILAEGPEVDALCAPYTTRSRFSCQIGPVVALNADRWRGAVESWPGSLLEYQMMLTNHEVGHLLGQHHPAVFCTTDGEPAALMAQQSSGVGGCLANPWPLAWEIRCAALHAEPLAPAGRTDRVGRGAGGQPATFASPTIRVGRTLTASSPATPLRAPYAAAWSSPT
jgi:hypothetical protein